MLIYTDASRELIIKDWPYGSLRTTAHFLVEQNKKGERVCRTTVNPKNGRTNKPKCTTYSLKARIVTGSDGRTYVAQLTQYGFISIMQSDLQHNEENIHPEDRERFAELIKLFD